MAGFGRSNISAKPAPAAAGKPPRPVCRSLGIHTGLIAVIAFCLIWMASIPVSTVVAAGTSLPTDNASPASRTAAAPADPTGSSVVVCIQPPPKITLTDPPRVFDSRMWCATRLARTAP